ncbi:MAG: hypothetical protein U1F48_13875 [Burkholderiales bacterium]
MTSRTTVVLTTLALAGCMATVPSPMQAQGTAAQAATSRIFQPAASVTVPVTVRGGRVSVGQEPIYILERIERVVIIWQSDNNRYVFDPTDGIRIMASGSGPAPVNLQCGPILGIDTLFGCAYDLPASGTEYKYSVQMLDKLARPPRPLPKLDPRIVNDY